MAKTIQQIWYDFALLQMAAESYLDGIDIKSNSQIAARLQWGNNDGRVIPESEFKGATRMTLSQADYFNSHYVIVKHVSNNDTGGSGFSGTLFRSKDPNEQGKYEYTISFRSTEYRDQVDGGDWERDGRPGADGEIFLDGYALAQIASMEKFYASLKAGDNPDLPADAILNVTGYSLGGHLATVFTELHRSEINRTYTFNTPGEGTITSVENTNGAKIRELLNYYLDVLANPDHASSYAHTSTIDAALYAEAKNATGEINSANIYNDPRHLWAKEAADLKFNLNYQLSGIVSALLSSKITQLYGRADFDDSEYTANRGIHAATTSIYIEDQPDLYGFGGFFGKNGDYGTTHSLTLIVDSLAVTNLFQTIDPSLSQTTIENLIRLSSNKRAIGNLFENGDSLSKSETDSLENAINKLANALGMNVPDLIPSSDVAGYGNIVKRNEFYNRIKIISDIAQNKGLKIINLSSVDTASLAAQSIADGFAYRYALKNLSPFAVLGVDYQALHNSDGSLDLYDLETGDGVITQMWVNDRQQFLNYKNQININNTEFATSSINQNIELKDGDLAYSLKARGEITTVNETGTIISFSSTSEYKKIIFDSSNSNTLDGGILADHLYGGDGDDIINGNEGSDYLQGDQGADTLNGGDGADTLYGGSGDDKLTGGKGNDRLEGGKGFDTYNYTSSDGFDTIWDSDGKGKIVYDSTELKGGKKVGNGFYVSEDEQFAYLFSGDITKGVTLTISGPNGKFVIENFKNNNLGILLDGEPIPNDIATTRTIVGDFEPKDFYDAEGNLYHKYDDLGNVIQDPSKPNARDDLLFGSAGKDKIQGKQGNDRLEGQDGDDLMEGGSGSDIVIGGEGNDRLYATNEIDLEAVMNQTSEQASGLKGDWITGGLGKDTVVGDAGNDALFGGGGEDLIIGGAGDDILNGDDNYVATSFDWTISDYGNPFDAYYVPIEIREYAADVGKADTIYGGSGNDKIFGEIGDDILFGESGNDIIGGDDGNDEIYGGDGNDKLTGDYGKYVFDSGHVVISGDDYIDGGNGNDWIQGEMGKDTLFGGAGNDEIMGDAAYLKPEEQDDDYLDGEDGDDKLWGMGGDDTLFGGEGDDYLDGDNGDDATLHGDDYIDGEEGDDVIFGEGGDDILFGGDGDDQITTGEGDDQADGEAGEDLIFGNAGNDLLSGGEDDDQISGGEGNDTLFGDSGDDVLLGDEGNDVISGGSGNDQIQGGEGHDLLEGDSGNDIIFGEAGNDTLRGGEGDDQLDGGDGNDTLDGGAGNNVLIGGSGNDTYVPNTSGGQDTIIDDQGDNTLGFGDGISIGTFDILKPGNGSNDLILQLSADKYIVVKNGLTSNSISKYKFADGTTITRAQAMETSAPELFLNGSSSADSIVGGGQSDTLIGGEGNDSIEGQSGDDSILGEIGNDTLIGGNGNDFISGGIGDDTLIGGVGNDNLLGDIGDDTLAGSEGDDVLYGGTGNDVYIFNVGDGNDQIIDTDGIDTIQFGENIAVTDINITRVADSSDLILNYANGDSFTIYNGMKGSIERFKFSDGSTFTFDQFITARFADPFVLDGDNQDNGLFGGNLDETLQGFEGDDSLFGGAGNDVLLGGKNNDTLNGGLGNDRLSGEEGNDTYTFDIGDGDDLIIDHEGNNVIQFGEGISIDNLVTTETIASNGDVLLTMQYGNAGDSIQINGGVYSSVTQVKFSDGSSVTQAELLGKTLTNIQNKAGTLSDETLFGGKNNDTLNGAAGKDTLYGGDGNDTLDGGVDSDTLFGGLGQDIYQLNSGMGRDTVIEEGIDINRIQLATGMLLTDIRLSTQGNNLFVNIKNTDDGLVIRNFNQNQIDWSIVNGDNTETSLRTLLDNQQSALQTSGNNAKAEAAKEDFAIRLKQVILKEKLGNNYRRNDDGAFEVENVYDNDKVKTTLTVNRSFTESDDVEIYAGTEDIFDSQLISTTTTSETIEHSYTDFVYTSTPSPQAVRIPLARVPVSSNGTYSWNPSEYTLISTNGQQISTVFNGVGQAYIQGNLGYALDNLYLQKVVSYPSTGHAVTTVNTETIVREHSIYQETIGTTIDEIKAGNSSNFIGLSYNGMLIDAGGGDDFIAFYNDTPLTQLFNEGNSSFMGAFINGNLGNDLIIGTEADDELIGGDGNDQMNGGSGADTYRIFSNSPGWDTIWDGGRVTSEYPYNHIWDNTNIHLGNGVYVDIAEQLNFLKNINGAGIPNTIVNANTVSAYRTLAQVAINDEVGEGIYITPHNVFDDFIARGEVPLANNYAAIASLSDLIPQDTVVFDAGITIDDLVVNVGTQIFKELNLQTGEFENRSRQVVNISWANNTGMHIALADANDAIGFGVERFQFANGQLMTMAQMLSRVTDTPPNEEPNPTHFIFTTGLGLHTLETGKTQIDFNEDLDVSDIKVSRDGIDLLISHTNGIYALRIENWYSNPSSIPTISAHFANGVIWDAAKLTTEGLTVVDSIGNKTLTGLAGFANVLVAGFNDTLVGGGGNDTFIINTGAGTIRINETGVGNTLKFGAGVTASMISLSATTDSLVINVGSDAIYINGFNKNDPLHSSVVQQFQFTDGAQLTYEQLLDVGFDFKGTIANDILIGTALNDRIDGGLGNDTMQGGLGNDTYTVDSTKDIVTENLDEGNDTILSSITYKLGNNLENLTLNGNAAVNGTGNALNNILRGNTSINTLAGGAGNDIYYVGTGDIIKEVSGEGTDTVISDIDWTLHSNVENLTLIGSNAISGTGNSSNNLVIGNNADNILNGGTGADTLQGNQGNDIYIVDNVGDIVIENANEGVDTVQSVTTYTLIDNIENLTLTGTRTINGTGNSLDNILLGNSANNVLNGGAGADTLQGSLGNDTYIVDNAGDIVIEFADEGGDTVQSSVSYTLSDNVENLTLTGSDNLNATGNALNNILTGNTANNVLDGQVGVDTMKGGLGDDIYIVDNIGDIVSEKSSEGNDTVLSSVNYTLAANIENLTLTGLSSINGTGNSSSNILIGNSAANTLNGAGGADIMQGNAGNDIYIVDNIGDVVVENVNEGTDTVQSSINYTLSSNIENLTLLGGGNLKATGNELSNILIGNAGANTLDGGLGIDIMQGGLANDTYIVDNISDIVIENSNEGTDTIQASVSYTLTDNVENLTLISNDSINGFGNDSNNVILGNNANNLIDGKSGADNMRGGLGDDIYIVDNSADVIVEKAAEGLDTIQSSVSYTLSGNLENLLLTGNEAINATGNTINNVLIGNNAVNTLNGGSGIDILQGKTGNDILTDISGVNFFDGGADNDTLTGGVSNEFFIGGTGNDVIVTGTGKDIIAFNKGDGQDTVQLSKGLDNTISLGGGISYSDLSLSKSGNNLILNMGNSENITLVDWYAAKTNHTVINLQMIAEAMAAFDSTSSNDLINSKVETFNFDKLASQFDAARSVNPTISAWALTDALLTAHLSSSDTAAIGGDLAYQYGKTGSLSLVGSTAAQNVLSNTQFGNAAQGLQPLTSLSEGIVKLG